MGAEGPAASRATALLATAGGGAAEATAVSEAVGAGLGEGREQPLEPRPKASAARVGRAPSAGHR